MKIISNEMKDELINIFHDRVNFKHYERQLYATDLGVMPSMIKGSIKTVPFAVVLPKNEQELIKLVEFAKKHHMPLTPRGLGTSGYGGSVPAKGGISVVFSKMNEIIDIDDKEHTVKVGPGIIWKDLERKLNKKGLSLMSYPSSYPGSTVGGWLAQGGIGIGSLKYGLFEENILEVSAVRADGNKMHLSGDELSLISGSMGTTALISSIQFKVKKLEDIHKRLLSFKDIIMLKEFLAEQYEKDIPFYAITISNPALIKMKNKLEKEHQETKENAYVALCAYLENDRKEVEAFIEASSAKYGFAFLDDDIAQSEWEERFYTIRVKKAGPSIIPSEVTVPLESLDKFFTSVGKKIKYEYMAEIIPSKDKMVTILGFILSDERKFSYTTTFTSSIDIIKIAESLGGGVYATGFYFNDKSKAVLGKSKYGPMLKFKLETDPENLLNPGKLYASADIKDNPAKHINRIMHIGEKFSPLFPAVRAVFKNSTSDTAKGKRVPDDVLWNSTICAQCGYCVQACELYDARLWESSSPRGKWKIIKNYENKKIKFDNELVETFLMCTTCMRCNPVCQVDIPIMEIWDEMRDELVGQKKFSTFPAFEMMIASFNSQGNIWAELKEDRAGWIPKDAAINQESDTLYWAGCTASYVTQNIAKNAVKILNEAGVDFNVLGKDELCCGIPFFMAGKWDVFEKALRENIENLNNKGIKKIIASCPGCWVSLSHLYKQWAKKLDLKFDIEIEHITQTASKLLNEGKIKPKIKMEGKVTYHDPCHIGRHGNIYDEPRDIIQAMEGIDFEEMEHFREDALCCGSVLTRAGESNPTADYLGAKRVSEAVDINAKTILTTCPCCEVQLRVAADNAGYQTDIIDISDYLVKSLGHDSEDFKDKTLSSWSVFGKMIEYMTPEAMAVMMVKLMDKVISVMPSYMQSMVAMVNKMPLGMQDMMYKMMKKMMPVLMPRLLPSMMPEMLPDILGYFEEEVPEMPQSMKKLMPQMMPEVMDNLMPSMLPSMIPLILDDMIASLKLYTKSAMKKDEVSMEDGAA
jgi:Fe-S oxidoreductase/FAD/FMN-containing dehydrogenase